MPFKDASVLLARSLKGPVRVASLTVVVGSPEHVERRKIELRPESSTGKFGAAATAAMRADITVKKSMLPVSVRRNGRRMSVMNVNQMKSERRYEWVKE